MLQLVKLALSKPYTFIVLAILIMLFGVLAAVRTPTDIFPDIKIPVIAAVWTYRGLPPDDMAGRVDLLLRAPAVDDGQRHRPYREPVAARHRHRQDLLPARRRHPHRDRAGHLGLADRAEADAAGHHAAADPQLQRLDRADPAARAVGQGSCPSRRSSTSARTSSARRSPRCRARRSPRPTAARNARSRSISIPAALQARQLSARTSATRSPRRTRSSRPAPPRSAGTSTTSGSTTRPNAVDAAQRPADQDRQRRDDLHARRRACPRRLAAAAQRRARRRRPRGADDDPEERLGLDDRDRRRGQGAAAEAQGDAAGRAEGRAARRPVAVREGGGVGRRSRKA